MNKQIFFALFLVLVQLTLVGCSSEEPSDGKGDGGVSIELSRTDEELVKESNGLSFRLLAFRNEQDVDKGENNGNMVIAPYSFSTALSMAANALADDELARVKKVLGFKSIGGLNGMNQKLLSLLPKVDPKVTLKIANSVWVKPGSIFYTEGLKNTMYNFYNAPTYNVDLGNDTGVNELNNWCSNATDGLISKFLESPVSMEMMMVNANYFHGQWTNKFEKEKTKIRVFTDGDGMRKNVKSMWASYSAKVAINSQMEMVSLPYGNEAFNMNLILPNDGVSVADVLAGLDADEWERLMNSEASAKVEIYLPKFKISTSSDFMSYLKKIEIDNPTGNAGSLAIGFAQQAVTIETDEDGTTAAVVSGVGLDPIMLPPRVFDFNKPFVFVINEKQTGVVLFAGIVKNP